MGLVVCRFRAAEPLALLPALRARTEELLGRPVALSITPPGFRLVVDGLGVLVLERGGARELRMGGVSWLAGGGVRVRRVRQALRDLGGLERRTRRSSHYRFASAGPRAEDVARAAGGVLVQRFPASAVLRAGLRTPVEIQMHDRGFDLEAPIVIFGQLYDRATVAAGELAERVPLGARL